MGQGLFVKVAQVVSHALALPVDSIKVSATRTVQTSTPWPR